jgi:uncharacterized protein (TIGR03000 family)
MRRILASVALALVLCASADAQIYLRHHAPRPVTAAPTVPQVYLPISPGALSAPGVGPARPPLRQFLANPYYGVWGFGGWGYDPYWPDFYEMTPPIVNQYIPVPVPAPAPAPVIIEPPTARLTLNVPEGSRVWLADKEVDAAVSPLVLESPPLREGQSYTFDVKVKWREGTKTEERSRKVTVEAGEGKSLMYIANR